MVKKDFEYMNLRIKQAKFLEIVRKSCEVISIQPVKVKFWDKKWECQEGDELAHIHLDTGFICTSNNNLKQMTIEEIEDTASHEVAHIMEKIVKYIHDTEKDHDIVFEIVHDSIKQKIRPSVGPGVVHISSNSKSKKEDKPSESVIDKKKCNNHTCEKKEDIKKCDYCGRYFCGKHMKSLRPLVGSGVNARDIETRIRRNQGQGHPCVGWEEYEADEQKRSDNEILSSMGKSSEQDFDHRKLTERHISEGELPQFTIGEKKVLTEELAETNSYGGYIILAIIFVFVLVLYLLLNKYF